MASAVLLALVLRAFVVQAYEIPSSSMVPTLEVGDRVFVSKLAYGARLPFSEEAQLRLRVDPHAPAPLRVRAAALDLPEFAAAFTRPGQPPYPQGGRRPAGIW